MDVNPVDIGMAAVVLPPLVALINQRRWPAQVKGLVALLVCLAYALVAALMRSDDALSFADWRDTALTVAGSAFAAYQLWWRPSGLAPAIESATSSQDRGGAYGQDGPAPAEPAP